MEVSFTIQHLKAKNINFIKKQHHALYTVKSTPRTVSIEALEAAMGVI